ncbi:VTC domain-containing protein [Dichotomocladium elegans]|nr:VTC domain-containing protein [Dichotomocladium elegans]
MFLVSDSSPSLPFIHHQGRHIDLVLNRLEPVHVPYQVASLGQLTDVTSAYGENGLQSNCTDNRCLPPKVSNEYLSLYKKQRIQPWRFYYLDLERLNRELQASYQLMLYISSGIITTTASAPTEWRWWSSIIQTLESEVTKVHEFYRLQFDEIQRRIVYCSEQMPMKHQELFAEVLHHIPAELNRLSVFVKANYRALFVVIGHLDVQLFGLLPPRCQSAAQSRLDRLITADRPFYRPKDIFELINQLNRLQASFRRTQFIARTYNPFCPLPPSPAASDDDEEEHAIPSSSSVVSLQSSATAPASLQSTDAVPETEILPDHVQSTQEQFWAHPDNVVEILLHLSKHLELAQGSDSNISQTQLAPGAAVHTCRTSAAGSMSATTAVRTIYFDTPELACYTQHIEQYKPITESRIRSYNDNEVAAVAYEEKIYYPRAQPGLDDSAPPRRHKSMGKSLSNVNLPSQCDHSELSTENIVGIKSKIVQRLWLPSKHTDDTKSLRYQASGNSLGGADLEGMQKLERDMLSRQMGPVLETALNRTVFSNSELVISIDTEIVMLRVSDSDDDGSSKGLRDIRFQTLRELYPYASLSPNSIVRFPFAVIKIRYQGKLATTSRPQWLTDLCMSPLVMRAILSRRLTKCACLTSYFHMGSYS